MNDDATTNVLGAVLVFALLFTFLANVEINYRPVWDEQEEGVHVREVMSQFADLKAQLEQQTNNRTRAPVSNPLQLGPPDGTGLIQRPQPQGELEFKAQSQSAVFSSPEMIIVEKNGKSLGLLNEQWTLAGASSVLDDVDRLDSLRIRITKNPANDKFEFEKGMYVKLEVTDANGEFAGWFKAHIPPKDKHDIWAEVVTATGEVLINQEIASDVKYKEHSTFWIDTLDPSLPFLDVLNAVEKPMHMELTYDWNTGDSKKQHTVEYSSAYVTLTEQGQQVFFGGQQGSKVSNYADSQTCGALHFVMGYQQMPQVKIIIEHGALIVEQAEGAAMVLEPQVLMEQVGTQTLVSLAFPIMKGDSDNVGGRSSTNVVVRSTQEKQLLGTTPQFSYDLTTEHPAVWMDFLSRTATEAGMVSPHDFAVVQTADGVRLHIYGSSASTSVHDVQVDLRQTFIDVRLR